MKPAKIFDVMDLAMRARQKGEIYNPLFVGAPGLGKTEIVQAWCKAKGLPSITLTSALLDAPEIRGFPMIQNVNGRQRMVTVTPEFWPDSGSGVVILEEVNRGSTAVMNCWMALTDARRGFDNYKLPDGWIVVGCINPESTSTSYDTNTMDPALRDRFEMFEVNYDRQTFLDYMKSASWHKDIINFVESGLWVYKTPEEVGNVPGAKYISPRTFSKVNATFRAEFNPADERELFDPILGTNVSKDFFNFRHNETPVMMVDLKKKEKSSLNKLVKFSDPNNYKNGMISLTVKDIIDDNTIEDDLLVKVVLAIPVEQGTVLIRELEQRRGVPTGEMLQKLIKSHPEIKKLFVDVIKYKKD